MDGEGGWIGWTLCKAVNKLCSAVQCSAVQYSTVQCSAVQCSAGARALGAAIAHSWAECPTQLASPLSPALPEAEPTCGEKPRSLRAASRTRPSTNSPSSSPLSLPPRPSVARAHSVLARFCGLKPPSLGAAARASSPKNSASTWPSAAIAHAVFARFCGLKLANFGAASASAARTNAA
eukprot:188937-Chlamydomonas_euryale.AAC.3